MRLRPGAGFVTYVLGGHPHPVIVVEWEYMGIYGNMGIMENEMEKKMEIQWKLFILRLWVLYGLVYLGGP